MIRRTLKQIGSMLGSRLHIEAAERIGNKEDLLITGVSTDTRTIEPGSLFVPLAGEKFDGHYYVREALDKGAAACLWQAGHAAEIPAGARLLLVDDTLAALQQLARAYRQQLGARVVGITGSNGKTTTKDMVGSVLATQYKVRKTKGNLNNHIGLPLTLLQLEEDTEAAVVEMGMSGRGEIELLSDIAKPDIAVITIIGESHLEHLGTHEEIARAKTEILSGLIEDGLFVYNGDSPLVDSVLAEMPKPQRMRTIRFGSGPGLDLSANDIRMDAAGTHFRLSGDDAAEFYIPLLGRHNVTNALAAIAVGRELGVSDKRIAEGLASLQMTSMRIEVLKAPSGLTVLNDAYNASPTSMRAALKALGELTGYGKKVAVLGDMLELGPNEAEFHREIGAEIGPETADFVLAYGTLGAYIAEGALTRLPADRVLHFASGQKEKLAEHAANLAGAGDVVLVKGSRGMRLEHVVHALVGGSGRDSY